MKLTKAPSRLARTKILLDIIVQNDKMCRLLMYTVVKNRRVESISKTANGISELHCEMERELEDLEALVMKTDGMEIFRSYGAYFMKQVEYITFKEMEKMRAEDLMAIMKFYVELIITAQSSYYFTEPELEDQVEHTDLITKYRIMLKHINRKNMENCLELQKKISKDHISGVVMQEDPEPELDLLYDEIKPELEMTKPELDLRTNMALAVKKPKVSPPGFEKLNCSNSQNCPNKEDSLGDKKVTNLDISSFEKKSKRESSDLITLEIKKVKNKD